MSPQPDRQSGNPYTLSTARISWRADNSAEAGTVPLADDFDDIYFSTEHGLKETEYVFLRHNALAERWRQLDPDTPQHFTIAETGFGTGLNFLASWRLWRDCAPAGARLYFISTEKYPLTSADLQRALAAWPQLAALARHLIELYPPLIPGPHWLRFDGGRVNLQLWLGDALESFEQMQASDRPELSLEPGFAVDAWFLDGFAPARNPALWNDQLYQLIAGLSHAGTTLATFTAVGEVRRGLQTQGFEMRKVAGFGRKRDMLCGEFRARPTPSPPPPRQRGIQAPWYYHRPSQEGRRAAVIGAGLAGTSTAQALARLGWQVTLVEREQQVAAGASGNPQGMLYTKLSPQAGVLNQFTLASFLFALRHYRHLVDSGQLAAEDFSACGVVQLASRPRDQALMTQLQSTFAEHPQLVSFHSAESLSRMTGVASSYPGWLYPGAGWLAPPAVCRAQLAETGISLLCEQAVISLRAGPGGWTLLTPDGPLLDADIVVIANSRDANALPQCQNLPLKTIRGQVSLALQSATSADLKTVICHEGYITPAIDGHHSLGATFDIGDSDTALREDDHLRNLASLHDALPDLFDTGATAQWQGRAALRCASPDYLPLLGPVPDHDAFLTDFAALRKNAHAPIDHPGRYHNGLYLNVAHGSRGLTSTPLCAALLAAMVSGQPVALPRQLLQALHPARFLIRDLIRNRL